MNKINQNKEKKKRDILAAVQSIFMAEGYGCASMDRIASIAQVTKQTVYRYYPSKIDLFRAVMREVSNEFDQKLFTHLSQKDPQKALEDFAIEFVKFHISDDHLATYRLLVTLNEKAPDIAICFHEVSKDELTAALTDFFTTHFNLQDSEKVIQLWLDLLISMRSHILVSGIRPSTEDIREHALSVNKLLLAAIA